MCHNTFVYLKRWKTHLGVITEHARFDWLSWHYKVGTATSSKGPCSNVRALTWHIYPVYSLPARRTNKWYHTGTIFLDRSSHPYLLAQSIHSGESQQRQTILRGDSHSLTLSFAPHTYVNFLPIFVHQRAVSIFASLVFTQQWITMLLYHDVQWCEDLSNGFWEIADVRQSQRFYVSAPLLSSCTFLPVGFDAATWSGAPSLHLYLFWWKTLLLFLYTCAYLFHFVP